jgi:hypothetical protein
MAAGIIAAAPLSAQEAPVEQMQERVHVVRSGDTLWDIARTYLNDPFLWPEIFRLNTDFVRNPARIYPSARMRLPGAGVPEATYAYAEAHSDEPGRSIFFPRARVGPEGDGHRIRPAGSEDVPVLTPGDFHRAGFVAHDRDVRPIGALVERIFPSVVPIDLPPQVQVYDRVFVSLNAPDAVRIGDRIQFYRRDRRIARFGRIYQPTGIATIAAVDGRVATAIVTQLHDQLSPGDLVLPLERFPVPAGVLPVPEHGLQGSIVAFQQPAALYPTQQVAYLDMGDVSGVSEGDEFSAFLPSRRERWGVRPEIEVARLQIVRVSDRTAAARVIAVNYPALESGMAVRRVARMP